MNKKKKKTLKNIFSIWYFWNFSIINEEVVSCLFIQRVGI